MKFYGTPNMLFVDRQKNKKYRFNEKGEFETDNPRLIKKLSGKFSSNNADISNMGQTEPTQVKQFICSECGKMCKNAAGLSAHEKACKGA